MPFMLSKEKFNILLSIETLEIIYDINRHFTEEISYLFFLIRLYVPKTVDKPKTYTRDLYIID